MLEYAFDTITPAQALGIGSGDTLTFNGGPARTVSVVYDPEGPSLLPGNIVVSYEGRTVTFGSGLSQLSKTGGLVMADGSKLFIGDGGLDRFSGAAGDDGAFGGLGADSLNGAGGSDFLQGNSGDDVLVGGEGGDTLLGGQGDDVIYASREVGGVAGEADDLANGNLGDDHIFGGRGADTLLGGQGNDLIGGGDGGDWLSGDRGDDELIGGLGWDTLNGGAGDDRLSGGFGADSLNGGDGDDQLTTQGFEASTLNGGAGNDTLLAAGAGDSLFGGEGRDRFEFIARGDPATGFVARIVDWDSSDQLHFDAFSILGQAPILPLSYSEFVTTDFATAYRIASEHIVGAGARYVAAQVGGDVYVFADVGDHPDGADVAVLLVGRTLADISLSNFV